MSLKTANKILNGEINLVDAVKTKIERSLSLIGVIIVTVAASIGSGLFVLPSFAAAIMGPGIWLAFLLAGIVFLPGTLSKSELASAMPSNGGAYVYVERSFGPLIGTISGLGLWASFLLKSAFALIGFSAYMYAVTEHLEVSANATVLIMIALVLITVLNILGIKKVKAFQTPILALTTGLILIICFFQLFDGNFDFSNSKIFDIIKAENLKKFEKMIPKKLLNGDFVFIQRKILGFLLFFKSLNASVPIIKIL